MALSIVRNDITKMNVDAIVNSTNEQLIPGGLGVDASIHYAAGPELASALSKIGYCPIGSCVLTEAYNIRTCRYIIHAVGPVHYPVPEAEDAEVRRKGCALIEQCYRSIYRLALERACRSVAVPLISSGANGFPTAEVYRIATGVAREFLLSLRSDEDMMIYIVLYNNESVGIGQKIGDSIQHLVTDQYLVTHAQKLQSSFYRSDLSSNDGPRQQIRNFSKASRTESARYQRPHAQKHEDYREQDMSFPEMCEWWCKKKQISKHVFYTNANITKATFWAMKNHPGQVPKKTNVLACAIGLRLDLDQTRDLLARAGLALSPYFTLDMLVEYFISKKKYDIDEINAVLFDEDLPLLGTIARDG